MNHEIDLDVAALQLLDSAQPDAHADAQLLPCRGITCLTTCIVTCFWTDW